MNEQRVYSDEFKAQAVEMAMQPGATKAGVARSLGINPNTLAGWIINYKKAKGIIDPPKIEDERSELIRLRRENRRQEMEIEILKKAAAYFAKELR
jgi:transposase